MVLGTKEDYIMGVKFDKQLKFKSHIEELCRKTAYRLHALRRIRKYLTVEKAFNFQLMLSLIVSVPMLH